MLEQFKQYISNNNLFTYNDKILLGVSGGIDSMVLCNLLLRSNFNFGIAHCNFQLRGDESDGDEMFVKSYAERNNIPFHHIRFNTSDYVEKHSISVQMAARDLRYQWFNEIMQSQNYSTLAVAHHADDVIETFFINLTRGAGLKGLCGMPVRNKQLVRPLLFASRNDIIDYATKNNINFREDSSNKSTKYARNKIRHNIIPELTSINPSFQSTMLNNIAYLQQVEQYIENEMECVGKTVCTQKGENIYLSINQLKEIRNLNIFIFYKLQKFGFKNDIINKIILSLDACPGKQFYSHSHVLVKDRDFFILSPLSTTDEQAQYTIYENDNQLDLPLCFTIKTINKLLQYVINKNPLVAQFDYDKLKFPLVLRKWQHGDSFIPLGMTGRKKLSNYFSDNKYSLLDKQAQWLLVSGNDIIWLVGKRIDDRFKVNEHSQKIWQIELIEDD